MLPVLIEIGPLKVHSWGVLLMLGFLLGTGCAARFAPRHGIKREDVWDVGLWGLFGGVIGARLAYILNPENLSYFLANPAETVRVWDGGMTFYGGMAGGILAGVLVCRARGISVPDMADLAAIAFPIGYAQGRVGCFLNGCCYGGACNLPWAVRFPVGPEGALTGPSHPAQLYSAIISLAILGVILFLERRQRFRGQLMLSYVFLYGVYRFLIEIVREGVTAQTTSLAGLTQGQVASLGLSLAAAVVYVFALRRADGRAGDPAGTVTKPSAI